MEGESESGFTFVNDDLDSYLNNLASKFSVSSKEPRACALTHLSASSESARKHHGAYSTSVTREFDGPKSISCFDYEIKLQSPLVDSIKTKFAQEPCGLKNSQVLTNLRFPPKLKTCYVKNFDFEKEALELARARRPRTRRKPRRTRYSLSENVHVNDDNYIRSNLLPTDEDLRTAYDKIFPCRAVPYIFGCAEKSNLSHNCAALCAKKVDGFRLFIEVPQDGRRLPPIVAENLSKIRNDCGVVDDVSAMLAVTAVRTPTPSTSRMFVPLSQDLVDKIETLSEVFDVDDEPIVEDPEVFRVVEDIVDFVDKQSEFPQLDVDPDTSLDDSFTLDSGKDDVSQPQNDVCPWDDNMTTSPAKIQQKIRKKKRTEKNRVVRELKKLLNISVKDEDEGDSLTKEEVCEEPACVLGCVCGSLKAKPQPVEHCGQAECIFECSCTDKKYFYMSEGGDLSKEEKSWHQTVVRKKGNAVELKSGFERSKRQSKLPSKYEDTFTGPHFDHIVRPRKNVRDREKLDEDLETEMKKFMNNNKSTRRRRANDELKPGNTISPVESPIESPIDDPDDAYAPKIKWKDDTNRKRSESLKRKCDDIKRNLLTTRLEMCGTDKALYLDHVFIWCTIHDKYDCHCSNYVVMTRNSNLLLKATRTNRYTATRLLGQRNLETKESPENRIVKLWDEKHCARSVGAVVNYRMRNKTGVYKRLLKRVLVEAMVSSFSNGFIKTKPVATVLPEELNHNFPLSNLPSFGVGTVTHISRGRNIRVEQKQPPAEIMDLSDDEQDSKERTDFMTSEIVPKPRKRSSETSDDEQDSKERTDFMTSEIVPKPRKRSSATSDDEQDSKERADFMSSEIVPKPRKRSSETSLCFSMYDSGTKRPKVQFPSSNLRPVHPRRDLEVQGSSAKPNVHPPLIDLNTPVQIEIDSADSDLEYVEQPMEVVSIKSSSDDDDDDVQSNVLNSSVSQTSMAPSKSQKAADSTGSRKSQTMVELPITIESDDDNDSSGNKDDVASLSDESSSSGNVESLSSASSSSQANPVSQDKFEDPAIEEEYPMFGLCNLKQKNFGYVPLLEATGTRLQIEIPDANHCSRTFIDAKEASKFMVTLVDKYLNIPRAQQHGDWNKVTRGVLKALKVKRFPNPDLLRERAYSPSSIPTSESSEAAKLPVPPESRAPSATTTSTLLDLLPPPLAPQDTTPDKKKAKVIIENEKQLIRPFPLARAQKEETKSSTASPVSGSLEELTTSENNPKQSEASSSSSSSSSDGETSAVPATTPVLPVPGSAVVGTFPNMSEAHSFLEKNYVRIQSQQVRSSPPTVAYTTLKSITSPGVGTPTNPPPTPPPATPPVRRGPVLIPVSSRFPGVKLSTSAPGFVRMANGNIIRCSLIQTPTHILGPNGTLKTVQKITALEPTAKIVVAASSANVPEQTAQSPASQAIQLARATLPTSPKVKGPGAPVRLAAPATITLRAPPSVGVSRVVCPILPKTIQQPVRLKPTIRRADVIVPRDTEFATVISPSPAQFLKTATNDSKVVYSGVVITKPDTPKPQPARAVICDRNSTTNFKSLLPQKSPPKSADK